MSLKTGAMHVARQIKHAGFVSAKQAKVLGRRAKFAAATAAARPYSHLLPYEFDPARYPNSFRSHGRAGFAATQRQV